MDSASALRYTTDLIMAGRRRYLIAAGEMTFELIASDVIPWLRGYIAHMTQSPDSANLIDDLRCHLVRLPAESLHQSCYRVLCACHDRGVIDYRGIRQE